MKSDGEKYRNDDKNANVNVETFGNRNAIQFLFCTLCLYENKICGHVECGWSAELLMLLHYEMEISLQ